MVYLKNLLVDPFRTLWITLLLVGLLCWVHLSGLFPVFSSHVIQQTSWQQFKQDYDVDGFGADGYFVRAVNNGFNLFNDTPGSGWRFTRRLQGDPIRRCADCHSPEDIAYSFVNADRFDAVLNKRVSFEERVMRCYAHEDRMNGFVPTLYDPAIRDLRIFARLVAHHLGLGEGYQRGRE